MVLLTSKGMLRIPFLSIFFGRPVGLRLDNRDLFAVAGWGKKKSGYRALELAQRHGVPCLRVEDGFVRSIELGMASGPFSIVVDD
jgi:capsular polysaccharide export protein